MVIIFASATALLAPEFVESVQPEKLASKFVKVEKEHGVKFNKTSSTFNIVGQWDAVQHAHKSLKQWWPLPSDRSGDLQPQHRGDGSVHTTHNFDASRTLPPVAVKIENGGEDPDVDHDTYEELEHGTGDDPTEEPQPPPAAQEVAYHKIKGNPKRGRHAVEGKQTSLVPEPVVFFQYQDKSFDTEDGVNIDAVLEDYEKAQTEKKVTKHDLKKILEKNTEQMGRPLNKHLPKGALIPPGNSRNDANKHPDLVGKSSPSSFPISSTSVTSLKSNVTLMGMGVGNDANVQFDRSITPHVSYTESGSVSYAESGSAFPHPYSYGSPQTTSNDVVDREWVVINNGTLSSIVQKTATSIDANFGTQCSSFAGQNLVNVNVPQQDLVNVNVPQQDLINVNSSPQSLINVDATQQDIINVNSSPQSLINVDATQQDLINVSTSRQNIVNINSSQQNIVNINASQNLVNVSHNSAQRHFENVLDGTLSTEPNVTFVTLQHNQTIDGGVGTDEQFDRRLEMMARPDSRQIMSNMMTSQGVITSQTSSMTSQTGSMTSQTDAMTSQGTMTSRTGSTTPPRDGINSQKDVLNLQGDLMNPPEDVMNSQSHVICSQNDVICSERDVMTTQSHVVNSQGSIITSKSTEINSEGNAPNYLVIQPLISTSTPNGGTTGELTVVELASTNPSLVPVDGTVTSGAVDSPAGVMAVNSNIGSNIQTETESCRPVTVTGSLGSRAAAPMSEPVESEADGPISETVESSHDHRIKPMKIEDGCIEKLAQQDNKENDTAGKQGLDQSTKPEQGTRENKSYTDVGTTKVHTQTKQGTTELHTQTKWGLTGNQKSQAVKDGRKRTKDGQSSDAPKVKKQAKPKQRKTTGKTKAKVSVDSSILNKEGLEKGALEGSASVTLETGSGSTAEEGKDNKSSDTTGEKMPKSEKLPDGSEVYKCTECDYQGRRKKRLTEHMGRVHGLLTEFCRGSQEKTTFPCDQCDKTFVFGKDLNRHKKIVHHGLIHYCKICDKSYKAKYVYEKHMATHEEGYVQPMFPCQICDRQFTTKFSLGSHIKSEHLGLKKTYICPTCGKSFSQIRSYRQHANVHAGIRPYVCEICGKSFTYDKSLKEHRYMHDSVRRFPCSVCNKAFRQRTCLLIHMKVHKNSKDHICSSCGKGFTQRQSLLRHERIHSGDKPYTCKLCGRAFSDYAVIRKHMLMSHKKDKSNWKEDVNEEVKQTSNHYIVGGPGYVPRDTSASIREKNQATVIPPVLPRKPPTITSDVDSLLEQYKIQDTDTKLYLKSVQVTTPRKPPTITSDIDSLIQQSTQYLKSAQESYEVTNCQYQSINTVCTNPSVDTIANNTVTDDINVPVNYSGLVNQMCVTDQGIVVDEAMVATILKQQGRQSITDLLPVSQGGNSTGTVNMGGNSTGTVNMGSNSTGTVNMGGNSTGTVNITFDQQGRQSITDLLPVSQGGNSTGTVNITFDQQGQLMFSLPSGAPVTMTTEAVSTATELVLTSAPTASTLNSWVYPGAGAPSYYNSAAFTQYSQNP